MKLEDILEDLQVRNLTEDEEDFLRNQSLIELYVAIENLKQVKDVPKSIYSEILQVLELERVCENYKFYGEYSKAIPENRHDKRFVFNNRITSLKECNMNTQSLIEFLSEYIDPVNTYSIVDEVHRDEVKGLDSYFYRLDLNLKLTVNQIKCHRHFTIGEE